MSSTPGDAGKNATTQKASSEVSVRKLNFTRHTARRTVLSHKKADEFRTFRHENCL